MVLGWYVRLFMNLLFVVVVWKDVVMGIDERNCA